MKTPVIVLTIGTTLLGAAFGYLLGQRGSERGAKHDDSETQALLAQIDSLEAERQQLRDELRHPEYMPTRERTAADSSSAPSGTSSPRLRAPSAAPWRAHDLPIEQRKIMVRQRNGALFRELGLNEAQIEALLDVLGQQDARSPNMATRVSGPAVGRFGPAGEALSAEEQQRNRDEIAAVIGQDKATQFENLKKTLPARNELMWMRNELEQAGEPVSEEQQRQLLAIIGKRETQGPPARVEGESPEDSMARYRQWRRERSESLRQDAASVLTPEQVKRLEESDSLRSSMETRMSSRGGPAAPGVSTGTAGSAPSTGTRTN